MNHNSHCSLLFLAVCGLAATAPGQPIPVPSEYQDLYTAMQTNMNSFSQTIQANWNGTSYPVSYSAQLLAASSENGVGLLAMGAMANVQTQLEELQALGIQSVTVHINFPMLYAPSYSNPNDYQQYLSFYTQVVSEIRSRGLKLVIESQVDEPDPATQNPASNPYPASLSWTAYQAGRAQTAAVIAQYLQPDYLTVLVEPDTEATMSGQVNAGTVAGSTQLLQTILSAVQATGTTGIALGAGVGTWQQSFTTYLSAYATYPLQYLDIHVYPVNYGYLPNAITGANIAHQAGMGIAMSEAWLFKVRDSELPVTDSTAIYERDNYSFWEPLDSQFLQLMSDLANYEQFLFISPFWVNYFFAYLDYSAANSSSLSTAMQQASIAMNQCQFTSPALAYENALLAAPDTETPEVPAPPAILLDGATVNLSWQPVTDNVGVAGYFLYKNGLLLTTTPGLSFTDTSTQPGMLNVYAVAAFDAAGNVSPQSDLVQPPRR
jgi:hypothetical protein